MGKMLAAILYGIDDVRLEKREIPKADSGEVVIKVKACAICGTDLRIIKNGHKVVTPPAIIGHEVVGIVVDIGNGVSNLSRGDSVVVVTPVGCGECGFCKIGLQNMCDLVSKNTHSLGYYCDGGFAEFMKIPAEAVRNNNLLTFDYDGTVPYEAISLVEPFSCVINGQHFLNIQKGQTVSIFGCGAIGCMHAYLARSSGAYKIVMIDENEKRVQAVSRLGIADTVVLSKRGRIEDDLLALTKGSGFDNVIVACSSPNAAAQAFKVSGTRAKISLFAGIPAEKCWLEVDLNNIHYLEKSIYGAFASSHRQYQQALRMILRKTVNLENIITDVLPLEEFNTAVDKIKTGEVLKVVIKP